MPFPNLTDSQHYETMRILGEHEGRKYRAAEAAQVNQKTFSSRVEAAQDRGFRLSYSVDCPDGFQPQDDPAETRRKEHETAFWKREAQSLRRTLADAENVIRELQGVRSVAPSIPPAWLVEKSEARHRMVLGLHLSDIHAGEVIKPDEIDGINAYDLDICERRLKRYFGAAVEIGPRWAADCEMMGAWLALNGDLLSGTIHEELAETNACTSHEAFAFLLGQLIAGCDLLLKEFGRLHVTATPGNHSRTTGKKRFKRYGLLSYDTLIGDSLRRHYEGDERVTFDIATGADLIVNILGWNILQTHGDYMGTGGGMGFAGPILPIARGGKKVQIQSFTANRRVDLIVSGHYHTSCQPGKHLANGSVVGYSEMGNGIRAGTEPPQQWLFGLHEKWLLRDRAEIQLEDPIPPEKPRVRIPAIAA